MQYYPRPHICMHIPLHIRNDDHARMSLEKRQLLSSLHSLNIDIMFTIDRNDCGTQLEDLPIILIPGDNGIVEPTKQVVRYFLQKYGHNCFLIRTGQDVVVNLEGLSAHIEWLYKQGVESSFLAGTYEDCNDIFGDLRYLNIHEPPRSITFVQGNFLSAPIHCWERYYLTLPRSVRHFRDDSIMSFCLERDGGRLDSIPVFWDHKTPEFFRSLSLPSPSLQSLYSVMKTRPSDVHDLLPLYERYGAQSKTIVEFGNNQYTTTSAFLTSGPVKLTAYNMSVGPIANVLCKCCPGTDLQISCGDSLETDIEPCDLLHLDTQHNYYRITQELQRHADRVRKFILIHDTHIFGEIGDDKKQPGLKGGIQDFLQKHTEWKLLEENSRSHGLTVLRREEINQPNVVKRPTEHLVLYRYHSKQPDALKINCLRSLYRLVKDRRDFRCFFICDNTPELLEQEVMDICGDKFALIRTQSTKQTEHLVTGSPCSPKHYTLYITSMNLIKEYGGGDSVVFFCEDDYLYHPDAIDKGLAFMKDHPEDFLSLYDHPDRYREESRRKESGGEYENYNLDIIWEQNHHWRTCISTCHSFLATYKSLELNRHLFLDCQKQIGDHMMWCEVWRQGKSKLWGSVPGLASHRGGPHLLDGNWNSVQEG